MSQSADRGIRTEMKAAVYHGPHDIRMEQIPTPRPSSGEVLVRVLRSGLCGTDVTEWTSGPLMIPIGWKHPHSGHRGPMTTGHEIVGEVAESPQESQLRPGALVVGGAGAPCWECDRCREGRTNICRHLYSLGLNAPGGHAEYVVGPTRSFVPIPHGLDIDAAGIAQPLAVGIHAARRSGARPGDTVVVIGAGAIGSFILAGLRHLTPGLEIIVGDVDDARLARAARLGADRIVNTGSSASELPEAPDLVVEASGAPGQLARAIHRVRPGGRVLAVGMPADPAEIDVHHMVFNEITLDSSVALVIEQDLGDALEVLASGAVAAEMIDSVRPLASIVETLEQLTAGEIQGKVLLDPSR